MFWCGRGPHGVENIWFNFRKINFFNWLNQSHESVNYSLFYFWWLKWLNLNVDKYTNKLSIWQTWSKEYKIFTFLSKVRPMGIWVRRKTQNQNQNQNENVENKNFKIRNHFFTPLMSAVTFRNTRMNKSRPNELKTKKKQFFYFFQTHLNLNRDLIEFIELVWQTCGCHRDL